MIEREFDQKESDLRRLLTKKLLDLKYFRFNLYFIIFRP